MAGHDDGLIDRYARALQDVYPGDWHDSDDPTECDPCMRRAYAVLAVRDEEMGRLRAELAKARAAIGFLADDGDVNDLMRPVEAERDALKAAVERVRQLHTRNANTGDCEHCSERDYPDYAVPWPCPTIAALAAPSDEKETP